jgi:hypothetical protein
MQMMLEILVGICFERLRGTGEQNPNAVVAPHRLNAPSGPGPTVGRLTERVNDFDTPGTDI